MIIHREVQSSGKGWYGPALLIQLAAVSSAEKTEVTRQAVLDLRHVIAR